MQIITAMARRFWGLEPVQLKNVQDIIGDDDDDDDDDDNDDESSQSC